MPVSKYVKDTTVIFKEGDPATSLFMVSTGSVLCLKASKDRLIPIFLAKGEDIIGENAMIPDSVYTYSAVTLSDCQLVEMPSSNFKKVLADAPSWLTDLTSTMVSRFESTAKLLAENRVMDSSIVSEEDYPPTLQNEIKKLVLSKTE